jgi:Amt family ammonium transporter
MTVDTGDTAWLLMSSALVMLMTPGLALFYGGMVRRKNILSTLMMSFACLGLVGLLWVLYGYSLSFGADQGGFIGGLNFIGLNHVGQEPSPVYATTVPHLAFMIFQAMFAVITVALITGAVVERIKFSGLLLFSALWMTLVYSPVAHWVWGSGGWLAGLGVLDFAGGSVVHINAGVSALALALLLGKRRGFPADAMEPSNIPLVVLGAGLLWFGWFGFNAGSALTAGGLAVNAFVTTNTSAAAAALTWMIIGWI